ncbi:autotransporter outer membrane beta-barrel domain-containing protein [Snodgrassella communis]|uniref:autotransporter outer membrane beta-barrel domain-containing protein n=1 Tax=Snodgrassella communis TaxID=2946699 RepID=UPI001EF62332|nr:autotransporter outer membrane beta-barrel domain-containing protein [Snodgrassella communis]
MNRIYRLIWSALHQAWIAVGELTRAHKKTATVSVAMGLSSILFSTQATAATQTITLPGDKTEYILLELSNLDGQDGTNTNEADGKPAYIFHTNTGTSAEDNLISIGSGVGINGGRGGEVFGSVGNVVGGNGGNGATAIQGDNLTINNGGSIGGGFGGNNYTGGNGGNGAYGVIGNNLIINNTGYIAGGSGGKGGKGRNGGASANAIKGDNLIINNIGIIAGGSGGSGDYGDAGNAAAAIQGTNLTINNNGGGIYGGTGGTGGDGGNGSNGGAGIQGDNLTIHNKSMISGGFGGYGRSSNANKAGNGGDGAAAILGNQLTIINDSDSFILGGWGGMGGKGGNAGAGIKGNELTIENNGRIEAGSNCNTCNSTDQLGEAAHAIDGNHLTITNGALGKILGGENFQNGSGVGGAGVNGDTVTITNTGLIQGGSGYIGGNAISGSNLSITNKGRIIKESGTSGSNDGDAIHLSTGDNKLTLQTGSDIQGDIVLEANPDNKLHITSEAETTIQGNLKANNGSDITLSGKKVTFNQKANFGDGTLTFTGASQLHADGINFTNTNIKTNITDWDQQKITLASSDTGISGTYVGTSVNNLLTDGAKDYAGLILENNNKDLAYGLKWFDLGSDGYGTFDLNKDATLNLNIKLSDNSNNNVNNWDGQSLTKKGLGTLVLSKQNTYTGETNIKNGTLKLGISNAIAHSPTMNIDPNGTLNLNGNNQIIENIRNAGTILINDIGASPVTVTVTGNMHNSGTLILNNCPTCAGQIYTQNGDWIGQGGTVQFGTVLGDDNSLTDQLRITGNATGTTKVKVVNEGGSGAQTLEGIELITTGSSSANAFEQDGRIIAGSYEYHLQQGNHSGNNTNNWYLTSKVNTNDNGNGNTNGNGNGNTNGNTNGNGNGNGNGTGNNTDSSHTQTRIFRPETGSYASNLAAANTLFSMRLADRQTDSVSANNKQSNAWVRIVQGHNKNTMSEEQSKTTSNRTVFQIGGDILAGSFTEQDQIHIGLTGGYARQNSTTRNRLSGYRSDGKVEGYSAGIYGTWYQNPHERKGAYIDSWLLYNWFHNKVQGEQLAQEKYHSHGVSASLETGYDYKLASYPASADMQNDIYLRPQAQIQWSDVKADDHTERNGTRVYGKGNGNIQTRLGMRLSLDRHHQNDDTGGRIEPFVEVNWLHNSKDYGVNMTDATTNIRGRNNIAEIKAGVEGRFKNNVYLWGNVSQQIGKHDQRDTQGIAGIKYTF